MILSCNTTARLFTTFSGRPLRYLHRCSIHTLVNMASNDSQAAPASSRPATSTRPPKPIPEGKSEVKILMLHGYTQSGPNFNNKTRALQKPIAKALLQPPINLVPNYLFPTGPNRLRPSDIPGFVPPADAPEGGSDEAEGDSWAFLRREEARGTYAGFEEGMHVVADAIRDAGGIDAVIAFSQGSVSAVLLASALELPHRQPPPPDPAVPASEQPDWSWVEAVRAANDNRPLRFCAMYCGYHPTAPALQWLFEGKIATPTLHVIGSTDTIVEESRAQALVQRCRDPVVVTHPGGHYVPVARDRVTPVVAFIKGQFEESKGEGEAAKQ